MDEEFKDVDVGNLSFYAVEVRYPDEFYTPNVNEAKECIKIATKVKEFVMRKLEVKDDELQGA